MSLTGLFSALAAITIYAGLFAAGRHGASHGLDGFDQTAIRFGASVLLVLPFAWTAARSAAERLGSRRLLVIFVLGGAPYSTVFLGALVFAPIAYGAALVPGLQPLVVIIVSAFWLAQRPSMHSLIGTSLCLGGLLLVLLDHGHGANVQADIALPIGIGLFVLSSIMWGCYAVALKAWSVQPRELLAITIPLSAILYLPFYFTWRGIEPITSAPAFAVLVQLVYQGVFVGVLAMVLYAWAVAQVGSTAVAALAPFMPVMAALIGLVLLDEVPGSLQWIGLGIVSVGLLFGTIWPIVRAHSHLKTTVGRGSGVEHASKPSHGNALHNDA